MSMLEIHSQALQDVSDAYHKFLLCYRAKDSTVYGIVEGKDDPNFYKGLIESQLSSDWNVELISANGKKKVIQAFSCFDWTRFEKNRICFYIDRDLSEFLDGDFLDESIYITDSYSIENEFVNFNGFRRIIGEIFNINSTPDETAVLENHFSSSLRIFREALTPIMAQIIVWRRLGHVLYLNHFEPKELFVLSNGCMTLKQDYQSVDSRLALLSHRLGIPVSTSEEITNAEAEFRNKSGVEKYIRGKYLLWFMVEMALETHRSISKILPRISTPPKIHVTFGCKNALLYIGPRSRCPLSLADFINRTHRAFLAGSK